MCDLYILKNIRIVRVYLKDEVLTIKIPLFPFFKSNDTICLLPFGDFIS